DTGGPGAARRQDRRHRHALRRAPSASRHPLMRVTVLTGGATAERAVAFAGAAQIVAALRQRGHAVAVVDTASGPLTRTDEARLLTSAVGREPPPLPERVGGGGDGARHAGAVWAGRTRAAGPSPAPWRWPGAGRRARAGLAACGGPPAWCARSARGRGMGRGPAT